MYLSQSMLFSVLQRKGSVELTCHIEEGLVHLPKPKIICSKCIPQKVVLFQRQQSPYSFSHEKVPNYRGYQMKWLFE